MSPIYEEHRSTRYEPPAIDLKNKNSSHTLIVELTGENKNVLEVGTSTGYISRILKERGNTVTGIEIDPEAGEIAGQHCDSMIVGDIEKLDLDAYLAPSSFDVIIFGDVLEHLVSPEDVLKKVKKYLRPDGYLAVSLPNVCHGDVILNLLMGDFKYTSIGLLDATHLRFFGLRNIIDLFSRCGYSITGLHTTVFPVGGTEQRLDPGVVPEDLANFVKSLPNSSVYQYIFKASPSPTTPEAVEAVPAPDLDGLFRGAIAESIQAETKPLLEELSVHEVRTVSLAEQVEQLTEETQSLQGTISERDAQVASLDEQTRQQATQLMQLSSELASMKQSVVWQLLMKFHNGFVEKFLPLNTRRRNFYDLGLKGSRMLVREGPSKTISEYKKYRAFRRGISDSCKPGLPLNRTVMTPEKIQELNEEIRQFSYLPTISIITPVYNVDEDYLKACINSVLDQVYQNWELCLVDDASSRRHVARILKEFEGFDERIRIAYNKNNCGIGETTNRAIQISTGEFIAFLDNDDVLARDALFEVVKHLNSHPDTDVLYSDEDKISPDGALCEPFFKPDWSPEYFRGVMYVGHLLTVRRTVAEEARLVNKQFDFVQDYEFMLRVSEKTDRIYHIPKILYHWRKTAGSVASDVGSKGDISSIQVRAVNAHLKRLNLPAEARSGPLPHRAVIVPGERSQYPLVSIIIPTKDRPDLIGRCLKSIFDTTTYPHFEVIVIDNGTTDEDAIRIIQSYPVMTVHYNDAFNFSKMNNYGVQFANGEYLIFLNNDTQIHTKDWIEQLLYYAEQPDVAAVGPLLLYPDNTVQHAGVVLGFRGTADHIMRHYLPEWDGYAGSLICAREVSAVTAACMMVKTRVFRDVGGFNEYYLVHYQDVDLCLKFLSESYRIIFTPRVAVTHYECATRGRQKYNYIDRYLLIDQWEKLLNRDRYYNPNFDISVYDDQNTGYAVKILDEVY